MQIYEKFAHPGGGGCWTLRIQGEDLTRPGEGKFRGGLRHPSELCFGTSEKWLCFVVIYYVHIPEK